MSENTNNRTVSQTEIKKVNSYAWVTYAILAVIYMFVAFHRNSPGVMRNSLEEAFNANAQQFAMIGSSFFYAYLIMQVPAGILNDKFGPKKIALIFTTITAIGSVLFGLAQSLTVAYIARFLVGFGVSVMFISLIKIQNTWFPSNKQALMVGITGIAANLGAMFAQTPLVWLSNTIGWRMTFIALGILTAVFVAMIAFFVKDKPEDIGLPSMADIEGREVNRQPVKVTTALKSVLSNKYTWISAVVFFGLYTGYIMLLGTFGTSFVVERYGVSVSQAANYMIVASIGALIAGIVIGSMSDKMKNRKSMLIIYTILTVLAWAIFVYVKLPNMLLIPLLFILGFVMSAFALCWTISNETNDPRFGGISSAVVNTIGYSGSAIAPVIMGNFIDQDPTFAGYQRGFLIVIILIAVGALVAFILPETHAKNISAELNTK
ncbi:MFS transporter [Facklamia sp. DSM 111018]|uniref:MFS transporter n=1 Tax=Facklamia lactis TaxID=2749967 RepID=A0ABS0LNG7_9LACT|nr:MFS transporter [Facklamia lactis]MBG9979619.1 MFS transporter [Facklamia lactis]MBG9985701.1 MFS transporter [Facklamia lactis]